MTDHSRDERPHAAMCIRCVGHGTLIVLPDGVDLLLSSNRIKAGDRWKQRKTEECASCAGTGSNPIPDSEI